MEIEVFWDVSSPYTYLAHTQLPALAERTGATLRYRPMLLGGVFKATGNAMPAATPGKGPYMMRDLARWRARYGVPFRLPVEEVPFPLVAILPMRVATVFDVEGRGFEGADALMRGYWSDGHDLSDRAQLGAVITTTGEDAERVLAKAESPEIKTQLRRVTEEAVERGVFGAPTMFVAGEMFWGNDRLDFVEAAAGGAPG
jgi:2-hydroxychromene-2-carboxylate isomerase